jgi:acyl carrier protein
LVFEFPTVETLAKAITAEENAGDKSDSSDYQSIARTELPDGAPLSFAQQRIWFLHQLEPGSHYNDHFDLRARGPLDAKVLERAINEIIRRHDTLRCSFSEVDGEPVQKVAADLAISLPVTDLSNLPPAEREPEAIRLAVEDCRKPFDIEQAPLFRASLVRIATDDHLLILTFDHIIVDGWSHGVFLTELSTLYEAFSRGRPSPLPDLPIQYSDFALWQQHWTKGDAIDEHLQYWKRQLQGAPPLLQLPTDHPRPQSQTFQGARLTFTLEKPLIIELTKLGRKENCTLFMVLLAGFQALLARRSECEDLVVGSPIANRNRHEVEPLIGSFMNSLAFRSDFSGDPSFAETLKRIRKTALEAYAHQDMPFERLVAEIQPTRNLSYSPIFQVMFILQNTPNPVAQAGPLKFAHQDIDPGSSKFDLTLNLEETEEGCIGWMEYSTQLFEEGTIAAMIRQFQSLLKAVVANPSSRLSELTFENPGEKSVPKASSDSDKLDRSGYEAADRAPKTGLEKELAAIWSEVLGVRSIARSDNLFDLGGHSLLITRIISRIRKKFQVDVPIHAFFDTPTVASIAAQIESEMETQKAARVNQPIRKRSLQPI